MTTSNDNDHVWLECRCISPEHAVRISLYRWGDRHDDVELWIEPRLAVSQMGFFERVWYAIKIVLGREPDLFAECIVDDKSLDELSTLIVSYRMLRKLRKARKRK